MKVIQEVRLTENERVLLASALELVDDISEEKGTGAIDIFYWLIVNTEYNESGEYVTPELININEL